MENTDLTFIKNLVRFRERADLTQSELSEKLGMSLRGYQKWEQGESFPGPKKVQALAQALNCTVSDLYKEPEAPQGTTMSDMVNKSSEVLTKDFLRELHEMKGMLAGMPEAQALKAKNEYLQEEVKNLRELIGPHLPLLMRLRQVNGYWPGVYAAAGLRKKIPAFPKTEVEAEKAFRKKKKT